MHNARLLIILLLLLPWVAWAQEDTDTGILSQELNMPNNVNTVVEYQPSTGYYVLHTRVGDIDVSTPCLMSPEEYKDYSEKQFIHRYWQQKIGEVEHDNEKKFDITDMKFNIGPADKVFGPGGVQLKLQGSAELLFGFKHQYVDNPALTLRSRNNNIFDFDEKIQLNVNGQVGTRLTMQMNYNTEASFAADQQNVKIAFKGEEDDIIQSIQAGNVSMDLNSSLIKGSQALFGIKTELKFGRLKVQGLISQQNSETQSASSEGGAQMTKFEVQADNYDENKHFFLSYYFRDHYEEALKTLPYVMGGVTINRIEVWVTNKRGNFDQARNIIAFTDLGEGVRGHLLNRSFFINDGTVRVLPYNGANRLYDQVKNEPQVRDIQEVTSFLQTKAEDWQDGMHLFTGSEDYDKIESARLLSSSEYTLNAALGYISLKTALQQDEVLAVAYEYTYGGKVYQVGEFAADQNQSSATTQGARTSNLILKMLRSSNTAPIPMAMREKDRYGTWHLMMKNIYSLGASSMTADKFELYVKYRNDSIGQEVQYLPEGQKTKGKQLIRVLNADRLDQRNNPYPDGRFDYVEGYTVLSSMGRIIFPVLEPFGSHLAEELDNDPALVKKYCFQELYDSTLVVAQEMSEKNKFVLTGKYQGTNGSEIRLNAMNIPRGSVTVTAGGATLVENVDYTVDYTMGVVTILNQSLIESGTNINVQLENQATFGMQRKGLYGLHMEYEFNKDFTIGGTLMHLRETPLTTKVGAGMEPLSNTIWGLNLNYRTDVMWLTNLLDKIPWMTATAPSTFQIGAEFAHLIPGHTQDVGSEGTSYIDDFESTTTAIDVHYPSNWFLSSTPSRFAESQYSNDTRYGMNRAMLSWYIVDPIFGHPQTNTPPHIKDDINLMSDHRTRLVYQQELFPNKESLANEDTRLSIMNLTFYPKERGPYNIYTGGGQYTDKGELTNPESRWGGIMRRLDNTDFERANIEYIEFWLMDPQLTNSNFNGAKLFINLGDVSEDILRDGKKSFEHGLPINTDDATMVEKTVWGQVPRTTSTTIAFSNEAGARDVQDVGLNGLSTAQEMAFEYNGAKPYADYVAHMRQQVTDATTIRLWNADKFSPFNDPAGDNYHYYRGNDLDEAKANVLDRYKHYNGTEGNSPESAGLEYGTASTLTPDVEDINRDNTLNEYEKYYEYEVDLDPNMATGSNFISEKMVTNVTLKNGNTEQVTWYKFKIPLKGDSATCRRVGGIRNFKSIRFMRMYLTGCSDTTTLRFATMDLVRGEWRNYTKGLYNDEQNDLYNTTLPSSASSLDVQAVSIEQDGKRSPVNYVLPPGISRQTDPGQAQLIAQDEQALVLRVHNLEYNNARAVYKATTMDMRNYKQLKMFVHAEAMPGERELQDDELACFIRLGTDMTSNYYEYEVPLKVTPSGVTYDNDNELDRKTVWQPENNIDFPFTALTNAKTARNKAKRSGDPKVSNTRPYSIYDEANGKPNNRITVMGNPTIEDVEYIVIGVRNRNGISTDSKSTTLSGEVWVNELRLSEFNEEGGMAAVANIGLGVSDIAQLNLSGRVETAGFGSIESNVQNRNMDNFYQFQVSAALEAGRLFPEKAHLRIPLYVSHSQNITSPQYDPTDTDIKLKESLETYETQAERDSITNMANTVQQSTSWSLTNMKVDIHSKKKDMFYDPANFSISVAYNKQVQKNPEVEKDLTTEHKGSFSYAYSFNPKPWEPFKKIEKVKDAKILSEFNIYYLPQSWSFNTDMHRTFSELKMRDFNQALPGESKGEEMSFSKDFTWNRNFDFKYNLTKNMKFSFQTAMNSTVDEGYYTPEIIRDYHFTNDLYEAWKDTVCRSMKTWGAPYTYQQVFTATWSVPFNRIPYMDWLTANASYNGTYTWNRTVSTSSDTNYGNTAMSSRSWQIDGQANFETLYGKSKYWKALNQRMSGRTNKRPFKPKTYSETVDLEAGQGKEITHRLNSESLVVTATDENGKAVHIRYKADGPTKIVVTCRENRKNVAIAVTSRDPNKRTPAELAMDFAAYFGTMIRRVQVTYRKTDALTVPGFYPQIGFFGQDHQRGATYAPGWDFAFGFFPKDFMARARDNGWLSLSEEVSQPATMASTSDFDIKLTLEPFPGFKVQVNGKRYEAQTSSLLYTGALDSQDRANYTIQETMNGSYNITQVAIATAFERIGKSSDNFASATFDRFLDNRVAMATRLQQRYDDLHMPADSVLPVSRSSADVLVPAFLSAYTKQDVSNVNFNPFLSLLHVMPNWSVSFDGLGRIPAVKEHFKSFTMTHAYTCKYAIGSYTSFSTWSGVDGGSDKTLGFRRDAISGLAVPSSAYDISSVSLTESFSPLIGVNMTLKNSLLIKTEYRKQRTSTLNINAVQITEGHTDEIVVGAGYTVKDLHFTAKSKSGGQRKVSNDLKISADFSYKNVATILRKVEEDITQASSGNKVWGLKISADYVISQKVNIQFFYDHQSTIPLISSSYPIKNDNAGINIKLMLTR